MGWHSTVEISREEALREIKEALENLDNWDNEVLSEMLFLLPDYMYGANFIVLDKMEEE